MKITKRIAAVLLSVCLIAGTLVFAGSAAEKKTVVLHEPVITVTKAEKLTVFELTVDFYPDIDAEEKTGEPAAAAEPDEPVFTDFDPDAVIDGYIMFMPYGMPSFSIMGQAAANDIKSDLVVSAFTAKPTAYNAKDGELTLELFAQDKSAGAKMFTLRQESKLLSEDGVLDDITNGVFASYFIPAFSFPQGLLRNAEAESGAYDCVLSLSNPVQNGPTLTGDYYGWLSSRILNRFFGKLTDWDGRTGLIGAWSKMGALSVFGLFLLSSPVLMPPVMFRLSRAVVKGFRQYGCTLKTIRRVSFEHLY